MATDLTYIDGGIVAPRGFMASGIAAGIKPSGRKDVALIAARASRARCGGVHSEHDGRRMRADLPRRRSPTASRRRSSSTRATRTHAPASRDLATRGRWPKRPQPRLGADAADVIVASTGVIGVPMPMDAVLAGVVDAAAALDNATGDAAAEAIMTTDTFAKQLAVRVEVEGVKITVGGMAKGSGMIEPNMATMLGFITTDAPLVERGVRRSAPCSRRGVLQPDHRGRGHLHQRHVRAHGQRAQLTRTGASSRKGQGSWPSPRRSRTWLRSSPR